MQRLEVSCAVRLMYTSLGAEGLIKTSVIAHELLMVTLSSAEQLPRSKSYS